MKRAFASVILLLVVGCASQRYTVIEPASRSLNDFSTLEIKDFTSNLTDPDSIEVADRFADQLHEAVMNDRSDNPDESLFEAVVRSTLATDGVLTLDGTIVSLEKGSQAKRYFIGLGSGKAYITIRSVFTDKDTGEQILVTNFDGELSGGIFGGSWKETVSAVVKAYVNYLDDYFAQ